MTGFRPRFDVRCCEPACRYAQAELPGGARCPDVPRDDLRLSGWFPGTVVRVPDSGPEYGYANCINACRQPKWGCASVLLRIRSLIRCGTGWGWLMRRQWAPDVGGSAQAVAADTEVAGVGMGLEAQARWVHAFRGDTLGW